MSAYLGKCACSGNRGAPNWVGSKQQEEVERSVARGRQRVITSRRQWRPLVDCPHQLQQIHPAVPVPGWLK